MRLLEVIPASLLLAATMQLGNPARQSMSQTTSVLAPADSLPDYFPLAMGNTWKYYYYEGIPLPDTTVNASYTVEDTVGHNGKQYYMYLESQGLVEFYRPEAGRVYRWIEDKEVLWFDFTLAAGDTYRLDLTGPWRPVATIWSTSEVVRTRAGVFTECYLLSIDDPEANDDAIEYWFAPNVGIVKMMWPGAIQPTLYSARIAGRDFPDVGLGVGGDAASGLPADFSIRAIYPQPFSVNTTIEFSVFSTAEDVEVAIYNVLGQRIATLDYSQYAPNDYRTNWNGKDASGNQQPTGIYFVYLRRGTSSQVSKVLLVR